MSTTVEHLVAHSDQPVLAAGLKALCLSVGRRLGLPSTEMHELELLAALKAGDDAPGSAVGTLAHALDATWSMWATRPSSVPRISAVVAVCDAYLNLLEVPGGRAARRAAEVIAEGAGWRFEPASAQALIDQIFEEHAHSSRI